MDVKELEVEEKEYKYMFGIRNEFNKRTLESSIEPDFFLEIPNSEKHKKDSEEMEAMLDNKTAPTSSKEALEAFNFTILAKYLSALKHRVVTENLSVHMITTLYSLSREVFDDWVRSANVVPSTKQFLIDCKIKF